MLSPFGEVSKLQPPMFLKTPLALSPFYRFDQFHHLYCKNNRGGVLF